VTAVADAVLAFFRAWGALVVIWGVVACIWVVLSVVNRRDRRRWDARFAADRRRLELRHQLWQMEEQIREEHLSDEAREWRRRYREEQAEVTREARRRLGLPEEDPPC
jgi:hypothetical protein